jgi:hypothetical protein
MAHKLDGTWSSHVNVDDGNGTFTPAEDGKIELVIDETNGKVKTGLHTYQRKPDPEESHTLEGEATEKDGILRLVLRQNHLKRLYSTSLVVDEQKIGGATISILGGDVQNRAFPLIANQKKAEANIRMSVIAASLTTGQEEGTVIITRP